MLLLYVLSGCNSAKFVPKGSYLLKKNKIDIQGAKIDQGELKSVIAQQPNRRLLEVYPFFLYTYNFGRRIAPKKDGGFLSKKIGKAPVIYDSNLVRSSLDKVKKYMFNKGYFHADIKDTVKIVGKRKKKIKHIFLIEPKEPYQVAKISSEIQDEHLLETFKLLYKQRATRNKLKLKEGKIYDQQDFISDREFIVRNIRNKGYYSFSKDKISFKVDTAFAENQVHVTQILTKDKRSFKDSTYNENHKKYYVQSIQVSDSDFDFELDASDYVLHPDLSSKINTAFLTDNIFIEKQALFSLQHTEMTYARLLPLKLFKRVNIKLNDITTPTDSIGRLQAQIHIPFLPRNAMSVELNGTNRGGSLGILTDFSVQNKNTFKNGEILSLRANIGLEAQTFNASNDQFLTSSQVGSFFNTINYGVELSLLNQRLLVPILKVNQKNILNPQTEFVAQFSHQEIPTFLRNIVGFQYRYGWSTTPLNVFSFAPIDLNLVRIPTQSFKDTIASFDNPYLTNTYQDHFLLGSTFQFLHHKRPPSKHVNNFSYKLGIESYGSMLYALNKQLNPSFSDTAFSTLFNIQYAHFLKLNADFRLYQVLSKYTRVAYRFFSGFGLPLQNSSALPFEKAFFAGGANGLRAWSIRGLGPGSFESYGKSSFFRVGDIQLEFNAELRFDLNDFLEAAVFADAGNIWLYNKDGNRAGADFEFTRFYKEIAIGVGAGLRFDFNFFIFRVDWGAQLRDPALVENQRWIFQPKTNFEQLTGEQYKLGHNLNIGIGYPF